MKALRIIILISAPLTLMLWVLFVMMRLQHVGQIFALASVCSMLVVLICSFIFALRYRHPDKGMGFDSL